MDSNEDDSLLWLFVIADHVRYMVYAVITDDCRRPDLGFTATERHTALQHSASRNTHQTLYTHNIYDDYYYCFKPKGVYVTRAKN